MFTIKRKAGRIVSKTDVSSEIPNDLHFILDLHTQIMVARKMAKDNLACTQPIIKL